MNKLMKNYVKIIFTLVLFGLLFSYANAVETISTNNNGQAYFTDVNGNLMPMTISYSTDGAGNLKLINSANPVDDTILIPPNTGKMYLKGADTKLYPAMVLYSTDGNGNLIPIPAGGGGSGTVTSVGLSMPSIFNVTSSPVTASGSLTATLALQTPNKFIASASTGTTSTVPAFRAIAAGDVSPLFGNLTGLGFSITGGSSAVFGTGAILSLVLKNDFWVDRNGVDTLGCGTIAYPCATVGYVLANLVISPSSTNNYSIHLLSGRHDTETNDILWTPYTWLVGNGGTDVGSYFRLPSGKKLKLGSGWTSNGRAGIQSVYFGGSTSVDLDFAAIGGSAGSNFEFDNVQITGTLNHTGRGINGGDYLYLQNFTVFGAATMNGSQLQSNMGVYVGNLTVTASTIESDLSFLGGQVIGAFTMNESASTVASVSANNIDFGSFTITGTVTQDLRGVTINGRRLYKIEGSGSTPSCSNKGLTAFTNAYIMCVCNGSSWVKVSDGSTACTF